MTVGKLKELLSTFDDNKRIVVKVTTQENQDNDYNTTFDYENITSVKDVGLNLIALDIPLQYAIYND